MTLLAVPLLGCPRVSHVWVRPGSNSKVAMFALGHRSNVAEPLELWSLDVRECRTGGKYVWRVAMSPALLVPQYKRPQWDVDPKLRTHYGAVQYGQPPAGYAQDGPARPLLPGYCYLVETEAEGRGSTGFRVASDGTLHELRKAEVRDLYGAYRSGVALADGTIRPYTARERDSAERSWRAPHVADSIAQARCYAGYRLARTRADTERVDRKVNYDTTADGLLTFDEYPGRGLTCQFVCTKIGPDVSPLEHDRRSECEPPKRSAGA